MNPSIALLIFSRSVAAEASKKKIFCRAKHNRKAAQGFIHQTIQTASRSGLPWHLCDEHSQAGNSFGEKLAAAIQQTFSKGYGKLLIIGNDCPGLTPAVLKKAAADLNHHDWVLGPDAKGGVYLIGLNATSFNRPSFEKLSWQTAAVYSELKELGSADGASFSCLPVLNDVNSTNDFVALTKKYSSIHSWLCTLLNYLAEVLTPHYYTTVLHSAIIISSSGRRGPPQPYYYLLIHSIIYQR